MFVLFSTGPSAVAQDRFSFGGLASKCIEGNIDTEEALEFGGALVKRYYELLFDASVFSAACADKISRHLFVKLDEVGSLKLVRYFWTDPFIAALRAAPADSTPTCNLACLLLLDRRPLPSDALFVALTKDQATLAASGGPALIARSLMTSDISASSLELAMAGLPSEDVRREVLGALFLFSDAVVVRRIFRFDLSLNSVCLGSWCLELSRRPAIGSCPELEEELRATQDFDLALAVKFSLMKDAPPVLQSCTNLEGTSGAAYQAGNDLIDALFWLGFFNAKIAVTDVQNGRSAGVFRDFNFVSKDVSLLRNIEFQKLQGISDLFLTWVLEQLETDPERVSLLSRLTNRLETSFGTSNTAARFRILLCSVRKEKSGENCNSRAVYRVMIERSIR